MTQHLREILGRFEGRRVVVACDLVLDEFLHGEIARVSREAPVLILDERRRDAMPGGGANAAANLRALGAAPEIVGVVGRDEGGDRLLEALARAGCVTDGITRLDGYTTPVKSRVLAGLPHARPQQVIRIDRGAGARVDAGAARAAADAAVERVAGAEAVLISDYGYDLVTPETAAPILEAARRADRPVTCDSRRRLRAFRGVTAATPNLEEAEQILGQRLGDDPASLEQAGRRIVEWLGCRAVLITRGAHGMTLLEDGVRPWHIPVFGTDEVADVTGAGDTVIAVFTLALACGATMRSAALLANTAAGLVVMKRGTATVGVEELSEAVGRLDPGAGSAGSG